MGRACMQLGWLSIVHHKTTLAKAMPCAPALVLFCWDGSPCLSSSRLPSGGNNCEVTVWIFAGFDLHGQPRTRAGGCTCTDAIASNGGMQEEALKWETALTQTTNLK